ncbi:MAG: class I SAM-dependent methyltransferase [Selenomonadaceae bacterium]|nr:class I SAM-dependent methyltransferase [Selenomonadaceae bacterium]
MIHINEIPLDFEPRRKILPKIPAVPDEPEMSEFESAFLCGALKTFRPKKILEIGVAGGATTAIILQTLEDLGEPYEIHSVDVAEKFYCDQSKTSGFMAMFAKEKILGELRGTHEFHIGKVLPQIIDEIGGDIDFVILDTVHNLPSEVLDFIAMLPYLKVGAVVVLHDVSDKKFLSSGYRGFVQRGDCGKIFELRRAGSLPLSEYRRVQSQSADGR